MISSSAYRAFERPWVLGGACILIGYISAWIHGARRYEEPGFRRFLHRWQMNQLLSRLTGRKPKPVGRKMNSGFHPLSASKRASMAARRAEK